VGGTVLAEIAQLLQLQTIDGQRYELSVQIDRLRAQKEQTTERISLVEEDTEQLRQQLAQLERNSRMKNLEVDELDMNIRRYQERLDTGIISFKEMEDLRAKIASERGRISAMEDEALVLMDTIEESRQALDRSIEHCSEKVSQLREQIAQIQSRVSETQSELSRLDEARSTLCEQIPAYLQQQYETLRKRSSEPISLVKNGTCSGCKLKLSGSTIERARGGMGIVTCEHCSRILYIGQYSSDS